MTNLFDHSLPSGKRGLVLLACFGLTGCSALGGSSVEFDATEVAKREETAKARGVELETQVARLKSENARLKTRVASLERRAAKVAATTEPALPDAPAPVDTAEVVVVVPAPPVKKEDVVLAENDSAPLTKAAVPVERAPRLVQPSFASSDEVFESDASVGEIELSSVLFGVHLASYRGLAEVREGWAKLQRENPDELGLLEPRIERVTLPEKGEFIRLIGGGFSTEEKALALCSSLKDRNVYCAVTGFNGAPLTKPALRDSTSG